MKRLLSILLILIFALSLVSCSSKNNNSSTDSNATETIDTSISGKLLEIDNRKETKKLVECFNEDKYPISVYVIFDQSGSLPSLETADTDFMKEVYTLLSKVEIIGKTNESVTDSYHCVSFMLSDGTSATFNFEGENLIHLGDSNYRVENTKELFERIRKETQKEIVIEQ